MTENRQIEKTLLISLNLINILLYNFNINDLEKSSLQHERKFINILQRDASSRVHCWLLPFISFPYLFLILPLLGYIIHIIYIFLCPNLLYYRRSLTILVYVRFQLLVAEGLAQYFFLLRHSFNLVFGVAPHEALRLLQQIFGDSCGYKGYSLHLPNCVFIFSLLDT